MVIQGWRVTIKINIYRCKCKYLTLNCSLRWLNLVRPSRLNVLQAKHGMLDQSFLPVYQNSLRSLQLHSLLCFRLRCSKRASLRSVESEVTVNMNWRPVRLTANLPVIAWQPCREIYSFRFRGYPRFILNALPTPRINTSVDIFLRIVKLMRETHTVWCFVTSQSK